MVTTDASSLGWGGVLGQESKGGSNMTVQGQWDSWQQAWHINRQELAAVQLTLKHFQAQVAGHKVLVRSDNTTTCAYINKSGGTRSRQLCWQAWDLGKWCIQHNVQLQAIHVPGVDNVLARLPVEAGNRPEGVGTASTCCKHVVQDLGQTQHRSFCVSSQPQTDHVLLPIPVPCSDMQGRFLNELGKLLQRVCIPTDGTHTEGATEGPSRTKHG